MDMDRYNSIRMLFDLLKEYTMNEKVHLFTKTPKNRSDSLQLYLQTIQ
jgi:hypothetical protein